MTYLFIAHDLSVVEYISNRIIVMYLRRIVESAVTHKIFARPTHPYTEALLNAIPRRGAHGHRKRIILSSDIPFWPYRNQCRLYAYKKANPQASAWYRYTLDDRFEHHDGARLIELEPGRYGIVSHGWRDSIYVHLWERGR